MVKVAARICDSGMDFGSLIRFAGALSAREFARQLTQVPGVFDLFAVGKGGEVLNAQIDANTASLGPGFRLRNFNDDV